MEKTIKIGLKSNANFLFAQMLGDTLGGTTGGILFKSIVFLNEIQFEKFKNLITMFGGDTEKSLTVAKPRDEVDFQCYFIKL